MKYFKLVLLIILAFGVAQAKPVKKVKKPVKEYQVVYVEKAGMKLFEDGLVNISYNAIDNEFDYRIKDHPIVLTVVQTSTDWVAIAYDPLQNKVLKVGKLEVVLSKPKNKWYQRLFK